MTAEIPSVNYHLWRACNMRCRFCFATYDSILPADWRQGLSLSDASSLIALLGKAGFAKITFAGGEPTLCPWLKELLRLSKELGLTTVLVTNGTRLSGNLALALTPYLDWLTLSVDSVSANVNKAHGRAIGDSRTLDRATLVAIGKLFRYADVKLKINTVVTRLNSSETLLPLVDEIRPDRWKIMRVLPIEGENTEHYNDLSVTSREFSDYVLRNSETDPEGITVVIEDNEDMTDSYVMIDPLGRFIANTGGCYQTSRPILQVGVARALSDVSYDRSKFEARGGIYDW